MNSVSVSRATFRVCFFSFSIVIMAAPSAWAYPIGAPPFACQDLDPMSGHGRSTATGPAPYEMTFSKSQYKPGETIQVTLSGTNGTQFKGFIIVGHRSSDGLTSDAIGNFTVGDDGQSQITCTSAKSGNGITHTNSTLKSSLTFSWTAPPADVGDVVFHYSVVRGDAPSTTPDPMDFFKQLASAPLKGPGQPLAHGTFTRNAGCGVSMGCYSNCVGDSCDWQIMFAPEGNKVRFDFKSGLAGDHYVAFGLAQRSAMYPASVLSCQTLNGKIIVQASMNRGYDNINLDDHSEGISNAATSYENGVMHCSFLRDKVSSNPMIFNLTQPWHFITARGTAKPDGVRMYHGSKDRFKTDSTFSVEDTSLDLTLSGRTQTTPSIQTTTPAVQPGKFRKDSRCGTKMGCFSNCEHGTCDWQIMFAPENENVRFDFKSTFFADGKYVAFGFGQGSSMNPASVLACQTEAGQAKVVASFNQNYGNKALQNGLEGISNVMASYENGILHCNFLRAKTSLNLLMYNLTDNWFLITARGAVNSDGSLAYHGQNDRFKTQMKVSMQNVTFDMTFPSTRPVTTPPTIHTTVSIPADKFKKDESCGVSMGCYTNAVNGVCDWQIMFAPENDGVRFDVKSTFSDDAHYVAFGFSPQSGMNPASVLACQTEAGQAKVVASFNQNYGNKALQNGLEGISNVTASYENGLLHCNFLRAKTSLNPLIYNLTDNWFLITARGAANADGSLAYHGQNDRFKTQMKVSMQNVTFDMTFPSTRPVTTPPTIHTTVPIPAGAFIKDQRCGSSMGCYTNAEHGVCNWQIMFAPENDSVRFDFKSTFSGDAHYVAFGFSPQSGMNPASVLSCQTQAGHAKVVESFNQNYGNKALQNGLEGISNVTTSYENGLIHCNFLRAKTSLNPLMYNLTGNWFFITARGVVASDGSLTQHGQKDRFKTDMKVSTQNVTFDMTFPNTREVTTLSTAPTTAIKPISKFTKDPDCGRTKACYSDCDDNKCTLLLSWKKKQPHFEITLKTEISGSDDKWVALGFSEHGSMGDASVVECTVHQGKVDAFSSFNYGHSNRRLSPDPHEGISGVSGSFKDGILSCTFLRLTKSNNSQIFDLDEKWFLVTAKGDVDSSSGEKIMHTMANSFFTSKRLNFNDTSVDISMEEQSFTMVKLHGCLMIGAWILSASLGIAVARFFKPLGPDTLVCGVKVWFFIHRTAMIVTFCLGIAAFIVIFVKIDGYSDIVGEGYKKAHPILGIIVTSLLVINPFMSLLRCAPDHPKRPLFNWTHFTVGMSAHILAAITIAMGMYLPKAQVDGDKNLKVIIGYGCWQVAFFGIMTILDMCKQQESNSNSRIPAENSINYNSVSARTAHKDFEKRNSLIDDINSSALLVKKKKSKIPAVKNFLLVLHIGVLIAIAAYLMYSIIKTDES